jgi:hypothetical protein
VKISGEASDIYQPNTKNLEKFSLLAVTLDMISSAIFHESNTPEVGVITIWPTVHAVYNPQSISSFMIQDLGKQTKQGASTRPLKII